MLGFHGKQNEIWRTLSVGAWLSHFSAGFFYRISPDCIDVSAQDCSAQYTCHEHNGECGQVFQGRGVAVDHVYSGIGKIGGKMTAASRTE